LINNDVIDFDLVFNMISFPGEFPEGEYPKEIKRSPLISFDECIGDNWFGKGHKMLDYGAAIKQLGYNYNYARVQLVAKTETGEKESKYIQIKKRLEDKQCKHFYPSDPDSDKVYWNKIYPHGYGIIRFISNINFKC
jgi:hypothetical protein